MGDQRLEINNRDFGAGLVNAFDAVRAAKPNIGSGVEQRPFDTPQSVALRHRGAAIQCTVKW